MNRRKFFAAISSLLVPPLTGSVLTQSHLMKVTLTSNEVFNFVPPTGPFQLRIVQDQAKAICWPANIKWSS